jgi:hypothetical protein
MTVIRFPIAAKLGEPTRGTPPMAERLSFRSKFKQWWLGPSKRPRTWNSVKFDYARRGR